MGRTLQKKDWGRSFVAMACIGILLGTSVGALAEDDTSSRALASEQVLAFQSGYIQASPEPSSGVVIGARETKQKYGEGDLLYLRLAPTTDAKVGDRFTIFRPNKPIYHPITRAYMGRMVTIMGIIKVSKPTVEGVTEALVTRSYEAMTPGDLLRPYEAPAPIPDRQVTSGPLTGVVLEFQTPRQLVGQSEIAYLDKGTQDGVALGNHFTVSHQGRRLSTTSKNPDETVAHIKIIAVQAQTSTASVLQSTDAIQRGDGITRLPPPPPKAEPTAVPPPDNASNTMAVAQTPAQSAPTRTTLAGMYFSFNQWDLSETDQKTLTNHADYLKQNPTFVITIAGYADERGSTEYNLSLGEKRAQEVRRFLAGLGVKNDLPLISYGKDRPVCTERNEPCYAKNRRVHLTVGMTAGH